MLVFGAGAFAAGLGSSLGPCAASRYVALAALVSSTSGRGRWLQVASFIAGLLLCYALLAVTASLVGALIALSRFVYLGLALCFGILGLRTLTNAQTCVQRRSADTSPGSAFITGGALGLVISPCCAPVIGIMATVAAASGSFRTGLLAGFAFMLGHISPLATVGIGLKIGERFRVGHAVEAAMSTVGGGLLLSLAFYYGILA